MELKRVKRIDTKDERGLVVFEVPLADRDYFWQQIQESGKEYWNVTVTPWYKRRTTGKRSQNHHFHGHCRQIAVATGNRMKDVEEYVIQQALDLGYPEVVNPLTHRLTAKDQTEATTVEFALLIEAAHLVAAELQIVLIERDEE